MFHANRWAEVFIAALGANAAEGLCCLKAMVPPLEPVSGVLFGFSAARRVEQILRESVGKPDATVEYSIRFITLLVEKNQYRHIKLVLQKIGERLDEMRGVLNVIVETAVPMDAALQAAAFQAGTFEAELKQKMMERLGVAEVSMKTHVVPELWGGYRLRIGGFFIDASLKRQIEEMKVELEAVI